jgi:two-component system response regulator DesR
MDDGAAGFLVKDRPIDELTAAIRAVAGGQTVIDEGLAIQALRLPPNPLSAREIEVLNAARDGSTINDIAASLQLSASTARNYLSAAIQKLDAANRAEARHRAEQNGWL